MGKWSRTFAPSRDQAESIRRMREAAKETKCRVRMAHPRGQAPGTRSFILTGDHIAKGNFISWEYLYPFVS